MRQEFSESIPPLSSLSKQVLIPVSDEFDEYIAVTPMTSMGFLHELNTRLLDKKISHLKHTLEPNGPAVSNYGEFMLSRGGALRMLKASIGLQIESEIDEDVVVFEADVIGMNIASGFVCHGIPAITAIGGMVHSLERETKAAISFAVGITSAAKKTSAKLGVTHKSGRAILSPVLNECNGNLRITILLKSDDNDSVMLAANRITRIAGGSIFNTSISIAKKGTRINASFINDASSLLNDEIDKLDAALSIFSNDNIYKFAISQSGYSYLNEKRFEENARNAEYKHCFAEPLFSFVELSSLSARSYYIRQIDRDYAFWAPHL